MDPTQMAIEPRPDAKAGRPTSTPAVAPAAVPSAGGAADIRQAASDAIRAMGLIRTYRVRGHLAADLDPLGLTKRELPADLTPEFPGFSGEELDPPIYLGGMLCLHIASVPQLLYTTPPH